MSLSLLFPGQGSQFVGMGRELALAYPEARAVFEEADESLGFPLSELAWEGPLETLTETRNAQPAILVHSLAVHRVAQERLGPVAMAAGHSLGEFSAHVAAGTLAFVDALRAVRLRGQLMFDAGQTRPGTMAAILGLADEALEAACRDVTGGICVPANFNADGQVVISGDVAGVAEGMERALAAGARKAIELKVSGAFHSPLMEPAAGSLSDHLRDTPFRDPLIPIWSNVTARPIRDGAAARELLVLQLTTPVRWAEIIADMIAKGATRFLELGPGSVLCGLNKRNARGLPCAAIGSPGDLEALT